MLTKIFKENLRKALDFKGLSQVELASRLDVSKAQITKYLDPDKSPHLNTVEAIAEALEIPPNILLHMTSEESSGFGNLSPQEINDLSRYFVSNRAQSIDQTRVPGPDSDDDEVLEAGVKLVSRLIGGELVIPKVITNPDTRKVYLEILDSIREMDLEALETTRLATRAIVVAKEGEAKEDASSKDLQTKA